MLMVNCNKLKQVKYFGAEKWDDKNNFVKKTRARIA